jgi:hypothetical protein
MNGEQDRALLRRFEPILRFTQGELFFPMDVEPYVRSCGLWVQRPGETPMRLVSEGELTLSKLAQPRAGGQNAVYFLKFIEPMNLAEMAAYQIQRRLWRREALEEFEPGRGRLARVGYMSRLLDAIFSLTLLARGRVPGDTATAAVIEYRDILAEREHYAYHARVVRQNGWIVLQYWFFYPFNNWRSGFYGASDHEADWEMVNLYLSETEDGQVCPEWVAYAAHDYLGDDLRRRWDDPELDKAGEHPVVYVAAGSHASYFAPGEYLDEMELPFLSPLARVLDEMKEFFRRTLNRNQNRTEEPQRGANGLNIFRIPFVDYARGDGFAIGPGQARGWDEPRLLNPTPAWVYEYRGLWGLYARDPISGENAPAGPMYNRDGSVRRAWYDPLGWAGLDKLPPPDEAVERLRERQLELNARRIEMAEQIARKSEELTGLGIEAEAMRDFPHLKSRYLAHRERVAALSEELKRMRAQLASDVALLEAIEFKIRSLLAGERGPARAHIRRPRQPASYEELRFSRLAETWAAISIGLVMIGFVVLVFLLRQNPILGLAAVLALMIFIESSFRGRLAGLVAGVTGLLAVVSALVILYEFFWQIVAAIVVLAGSYIVWENVREL